MRDRDMLFNFDEIKILWQYLYLSEEHSIKVENMLGIPLEFSMDENGVVWKKNLHFPEVPKTCECLKIPIWLGIIEQLKTKPAEEIPNGRFKNRWDEIRTLTLTTVALNRKSE